MAAGKRPFLFGVLVLFISGTIVKLLGLVNYIVLINIKEFGDRGIGLYSAGFTIYMVLLAISTMGIPAAVSKMVAESSALGKSYEAHRIFKVTFYFLAAVGAFFTAALIAASGPIALLVKMPDATLSIIALAPTIFFAAIMASYRGYFQGMQDMTPQAVSQTVEQVFKLLFSILFVVLLLPYGIRPASAGATFGTTAGALCGTIYLSILYNFRKKSIWAAIRKEGVPEKVRKPGEIIKALLKLSVPISLGAVILTISSVIDLATVVDRLLHAGFTGVEAERLYGQLAGKCQQLINFPVALNLAIATAIVPAVAGAMAVKDLKTVQQRVATVLRLTMVIALPSAVGMSVLADPILKIIYPNQSDGGRILQVLAYSIIFMAISQTLAGILQGLGKVNITAVSLLIGAAVKLAVNFMLVPIRTVNIFGTLYPMDITGAAYGSIACYVVSSSINFIALRRSLKFKIDIPGTIIKPAAAASIMGFAAIFMYRYLFLWTGSLIISAAVTVLASVAVFLGLLVLSGAVSYADFEMVPAGRKVGDYLVRMRLLRK